MGGRRRKQPFRTDEELLARPETMAILRAVAEGRVTRNGTGYDAGYVLDGELVGRLPFTGLVDQELIGLPLSGPPRLDPRGRELLRRLDGERT